VQFDETTLNFALRTVNIKDIPVEIVKRIRAFGADPEDFVVTVWARTTSTPVGAGTYWMVDVQAVCHDHRRLFPQDAVRLVREDARPQGPSPGGCDQPDRAPADDEATG
jgi:hypothetical protein